MPKHSVSPEMRAHLQRAVTTMAGCWRIVRHDGAEYGFTTFDSDIVVEGLNYRSIDGFSTTAIQSGSTGHIDNLQVIGFFSNDPGGVSEHDVKNRLFDFARIYLFFINWADPTMAPLRIRTGWLGETVIAPNGTFAAELRGLTQALVQEFGNFFSPLCRADLGDHLCKVPIMPDTWQPGQKISKDFYVRVKTPTDDVRAQAIFQATQDGTTWSTEPNWNTDIDGITYDNDVIWKCRPAYRQIGAVITPIDRHGFVSTPLSYPASLGIGTQGSIAVINSVSRGSIIEVNDGIYTYNSSPATFDIPKHLVLIYLWNNLNASPLNMTYVALGDPNNYYGIQLNNHTGLKGSITKSGDILGSIIIENFGDAYLDAGTITWITGNNAGVSIELKHYEPTTNIVSMWLSMLMPIQAGDRFWYFPGCDKRRDSCLRKFNNINNFRGEPDMPGVDKMLSYPDA